MQLMQRASSQSCLDFCSAAQHSTAQHSSAQLSSAQQPWFSHHETPNHKQLMQFCKGMRHSMNTFSALHAGPIQLTKSPLVARQAKIALSAQACHISKTGTMMAYHMIL